jgi:hypothetical protein
MARKEPPGVASELIYEILERPTRSIVCKRRQGDVIIDIFAEEDGESDEVATFAVWAKAWWLDQPEQLGLIDNDGFDDELRRFNSAVQLRVRQGEYIPNRTHVWPTKHKSSQAIEDDQFLLAATLGRSTIGYAITSAQERGVAWAEDPTTLSVFRSEGNASALVTLRPFGQSRSQGSDPQFLQVALERWKEMDQDVLDILVNNFILNKQNRNLNSAGFAHISFDAVLDARNIAKKTAPSPSGKVYTSGHRAKDRVEVEQSILRLYNMGALINPSEEERKKKIAREAPVLVIHHFEVNTDNGYRTGLWYSLGSWAQEIPNKLVLAPAEVLAFHPERESMEKRLGRFLAISLATRASGAWTIESIFEELHLPIDPRNPGRVQTRFEAALNKLRENRIIASWGIDPDLHDRPLPARGFLKDWMSRRLVATVADRTMQR